MSKREPDGYCAWHPKEGWLGKEYLFSLRADFEGAMEELREAFEEEGVDFVPWIRAQGWQIRPVWLSTEPPEEWVSVEERLPEGDKLVLCWAPCLESPTYGWYEDDICKWCVNDEPLTSKLKIDRISFVTHWRPLPPKPTSPDNKTKE